jgi:hypothetical protein
VSEKIKCESKIQYPENLFGNERQIRSFSDKQKNELVAVDLPCKKC